ncbi:fimbrial biogenesis chaperone [Glaciimonas soli]|uniref:Fimbria/pilus periplasmic chaperone n=1 Tax=Glaciimonas soli TaxID=2590999 RepID=A0A843YPT3_9BURK|nr:fimbria/pilus periplasmic chaperone [Glaciimonas soli]MQQ99552.1 fimbria/pilus periplasmic chaperone [Glaciimonas soli]
MPTHIKTSSFVFTSLLSFSLFFGLIGLTENSSAASFNVNPIGFTLTPQRPSSVLRITNTDDAPVRLQVISVDWHADGHEEVLQESNPLLLNPPIFTIAPGQTQYVRFGVRNQIDSSHENTYRLLVEEVPSGQNESGLKTLLHVSIPVFIAPEKQEEKLKWQLLKGNNGLILSLLNSGNIHTKITHLTVTAINDKNSDKNSEGSDIIFNTPTYVLPGQDKRWLIVNQKIRTDKVHLLVQTDKGNVEENLTLETE